MITDGRKTIGVFMNKADLNFQNTVQRVAQQRAKELNYDLFFFFTVGYRESANYYDIQEKSMFTFTPMEKLDGALVTPDAYDMPGFREALFDMLDQRANCPIVCVRDRLSPYDSFYTDESVAIRPLMKHLIEDHGFRKVFFLAGYKEHPDSNARLECYLDEMKKHGLEVPANAIYHGSMWSRGIKEACESLLSDPDNQPEAIVCANDYMAHALVEALKNRGLRVPQDIVVTGFDDIEASQRSNPTLTTVGQDYSLMVTRAMDRLHERIQAKEKGLTEFQNQHVGIPGSLAIRESCGCSPSKDVSRLMDEVHMLEQANRTMGNREVSQTYFSIELNSAENYEDIHRTIFRKMEDIPMVRDFYLCLFENEKGYAEKITPQARLISMIRDRQDCGMPQILFDREQLLPPVAERPDEPQVFYVHLLHQREGTYGYTVMQFNEGETPSMFYLHWNIIVSIALRNLANQTKLRKLYEERRRSSITDVLTSLNNRRGFDEQVSPLWNDMCREGKTVCFASLDLDNLKPINDTYGHKAGDLALRTIADALRASLPEGATAARMGGDEYLVFLPDCDQAKAQQFHDAFYAYLDARNAGECQFTVGASMGLEVITLQEGITQGECIHASDEAMYQEKTRRHAELKRHAQIIGANHAKE